MLLEAFDAADLETAGEVLGEPGAKRGTVLVGINCRDLQTLKVVPERFAELAPLLPAGLPAVAESGVAQRADACDMRRLGYGLALIGTALMAGDDPASCSAKYSRRRGQCRP